MVKYANNSLDFKYRCKIDSAALEKSLEESLRSLSAEEKEHIIKDLSNSGIDISDEAIKKAKEDLKIIVEDTLKRLEYQHSHYKIYY